MTISTCIISKKDSQYMDEAIEEAHKSCVCQRHGCVLASNGKIVSKGYNSYRTTSSDGLIKDCYCCHAEIAAIRDYLRSIKLRGHFSQWIKRKSFEEDHEKNYDLHCPGVT